jgi:hypothetical protein
MVVEKGTLIHSWWGYELGQQLWNSIWKHLEKLKLEKS